MPDFEQNQGTNLNLKSASRPGTERSEILNNGSTQHLRCVKAWFEKILKIPNLHI